MAQDVLKALEANAQQGRSGLYRWLSANYEKLRPGLAVPRPPWVALAKTAADLGITNGGKQYSRQAVRQTWLRVEADKAAQGVAASSARGTLTTSLGAYSSPRRRAVGHSSEAPVVTPAPAPDPFNDPPPTRRRIELKPVTMRNSIPAKE